MTYIGLVRDVGFEFGRDITDGEALYILMNQTYFPESQSKDRYREQIKNFFKLNTGNIKRASLDDPKLYNHYRAACKTMPFM